MLLKTNGKIDKPALPFPDTAQAHAAYSEPKKTDYVDSVDAFLKLLLNVGRLPEGEEFADDRVIAMVSILILIEHPNEILTL
jgi:hypothetical protein